MSSAKPTHASLNVYVRVVHNGNSLGSGRRFPADELVRPAVPVAPADKQSGTTVLSPPVLEPDATEKMLKTVE